MRYSGDAYYEAAKLMDLKIQGTLGLTQRDVKAVSDIDGVELAEGGYSNGCYEWRGRCQEGSSSGIYQQQFLIYLQQMKEGYRKKR